MTNAKRALEQGEGVLRLAPTWVPRSFNIPGRRIKLHPSRLLCLRRRPRRHRPNAGSPPPPRPTTAR